MTPASTDATSTPFPWRRQLLMGVLLVGTIAASQMLVGWYNGRGFRPLTLAGFLIWITTAFALGVRRQWLRQRSPERAERRLQFSILELLVLVTSLTFFLGLTAADQLEWGREHRERERLKAQAAGVLGPDGWIGFEADGSVNISICDRSFDDSRLAELAAMLRGWRPPAKVGWLMFASGQTTGRTPAAWPGVTDRSVPLILEWGELEWLSVFGTSISDAGREELLTLPRLNDFSREQLERQLKGLVPSGP